MEIIAIGAQPTQTDYQGIIFKEDVRNFDRRETQMHDCFRPGDIVKAKVKLDSS